MKDQKGEQFAKNDQISPAQSAVSEEEQMVATQKRSKRSTLYLCIAIAVSVVLVLVAVLIPVITHVVNPYRGYKKVIARFKLSNGMKLEYVIDEQKYDTAATNFIFLAENGFFDDTVFYDAQGGWLRFGGFDNQPKTGSTSVSEYARTSHRGDSVDYCSKFDALPNSYFEKDIHGNVRVTYKFGYRLRADSNGSDKNVISQLGALTFRYNDTATEFQFYYGDRAETVPNDISQIPSTMVGYPLNDETTENIQKIASANPTTNPNITSGYVWKPPTPDIRIKSVDVFNLDGKKWDKFNFMEYMSANNSAGLRRYSSWVGKA